MSCPYEYELMFYDYLDFYGMAVDGEWDAFFEKTCQPSWTVAKKDAVGISHQHFQLRPVRNLLNRRRP